jgi:histone deacetylase 6
VIVQSCAVSKLTLVAKTDVTKRYIDWAIEKGFQVVDVNIPKIVAVEDVRLNDYCFSMSLMRRQPEVGYVRVDDSATRSAQTRELAAYLWENYIQ